MTAEVVIPAAQLPKIYSSSPYYIFSITISVPISAGIDIKFRGELIPLVTLLSVFLTIRSTDPSIISLVAY
jgi:hypothetical protein